MPSSSTSASRTCPGDVTLWPKLTGGEVIDLFGRLRGDLDPARRDDLIERFELDPTKRSRTYSKGNRQKVALIAGLASDAELLILDEPTAGLDPLMEATFQDCIQEVRQAGRSVLLSSHILSEVEALCDRVTILRAGRTVEAGTLDDLRQLTLTTVIAETERSPVGLAEHPGVHGFTVDGRVGALRRRRRRPGRRHPSLERGRAPLASAARRPTLEELFLRHYGDQPDRPDGTRSTRESRPVSHRAAAGVLVRLIVRRDRVALRALDRRASCCWCS